MRFRKIWSLLILVPLFTTAQNDSIENIGDTDFREFESYTDSLLHLWYNQNAPFNKDLGKNLFANDTTNAPYFSDDVLITQLNRMNTYVEMTYNDITKQYIDFYSRKRRNLVSYMLGNSQYYFSYFEEALDRYGLPLELKYLPVIESALNPRAYSRARAVGLWQFILSTAKLYNLKVTSFMDERMDPIKSSDAAARYLRDLYNVFQDWHLAIAAYNCGPGNINRAIKRSGKTTYWGMYRYLPRETRGYVPAFIAAAYTFHYYKELNIVSKQTYYPPHVDTVYVNKMLHLRQVSEVLHIPLELLELLNPQYKKDIIPALPDQPLPLYLPVEYISGFITLSDSIYHYKDTLLFQSIRPSLYASSVSKHNDCEEVAVYHKIRNGETLQAVARKYHVSVSDLKSWNNIHGKKTVKTGRSVVIFVLRKKPESPPKQVVDTIAKTSVQMADTSKAENIIKSSNYVVKQGDTLFSIAKQMNVSVDDLCKTNHINNSSSIKVGQSLTIPKP